MVMVNESFLVKCLSSFCKGHYAVLSDDDKQIFIKNIRFFSYGETQDNKPVT